MRVAADQEGKLYIFEQRQQPRPPQWGAFAPRREVCALHCSRVTKAHRRHGNVSFVIKALPIELQPIAKPIARRIVPRDAAFMHAAARRLARNQNPRLGMNPHDRSRLVRQMRCADAACADFRHQGVQGMQSFEHRGSVACDGLTRQNFTQYDEYALAILPKRNSTILVKT